MLRIQRLLDCREVCDDCRGTGMACPLCVSRIVDTIIGACIGIARDHAARCRGEQQLRPRRGHPSASYQMDMANLIANDIFALWTEEEDEP